MNSAKSGLVVFDQKMIEDKNFWINKLSRSLSVSGVRPDFERSVALPTARESVNIDLNGQVFEKLKELTGNGPFLLYTTLMAALKICIYKYTANPSVVVGSPARKQNDEHQVVNALPIVDELNDDLTCRELLLNVRKTLLEAYSKQNYPYDRLIKDLALSGIENKCLLFDIALVLDDIHSKLPELNNDITLTFATGAAAISGNITYNPSLYNPDTISRFADHFYNSLRGMLNNSSAPIYSISLLSESERHKVLVEWNRTSAGYDKGLCIHQLFQQQVERNKFAVAVVSKQHHLSYSELNRKANQVARWLKSLGVGTEDRVGVLMERSAELVIMMLGIFKAGAAYLPLDGDYPKQRLDYLIKDSGVQVVVTNGNEGEALAGQSYRVLNLEDEWETIAQQDGDDFDNEATADNLAYVIYTSGSTGVPKGVQVTHSSVHNLTKAQIEAFGLSSESRVLQFASVSFDASVSEIFTTLLSGATLFLDTRDSMLPGPILIGALRNQEITVATVPPSVLAVMPTENLPSLKTLIVAGEPCTVDVFQRWSPGHRFLNAYGPTETTVCATIGEGFTADQPPDIGRPILNTQTYLLDAHLQPVPEGVSGELYIGGESLARGYINRADLTAEKFIPDPFSQDEGRRLYRTGDLARYLRDGRIEFSGRIDEQIKVRGFRIEPAEIERALMEHRGVKEAVVMASEEVGAERRLVGYVVMEEGREGSVSEMREHLKERLPDYMVPTGYIFLEKFELTPNGKIDRKALPKPDGRRQQLETEFVAPQTEVERKIASIWLEILHLDKVGIHDNFFDLGGHSLLMTQVHRKLRDAFNLKISLIELFKYPNVVSLARYITELQPASDALHGVKDRARKQKEALRQRAIVRGRKRNE